MQVKLIRQCNNAAENRAISATYPIICPSILDMQDKLEEAFAG